MTYEEHLRIVKLMAERDCYRECLDKLRSAVMGRDVTVRGMGDKQLHEVTDEAVDAVRTRLMPEGMEWPRYDTGEMVIIGDQIGTPNGGGELCGVEFSSCGMCTLSTEGANGEEKITIDLNSGERVKRPAALAADGEPLEVGQTVWNVEDGTEWCVTKAKDGKVFIAFEDFAAEECDPSLLTHQRPVLDADGVPIKKGDTVYLLPGEWCNKFPCWGFIGGEKLNVTCLNPKCEVSGSIRCSKVGGIGHCFPQPSQLTHTKPEQDSWERIEDDATKQPYSYCVERGLDDDALPTNEKFGRDLVRRCKALAGVSE